MIEQIGVLEIYYIPDPFTMLSRTTTPVSGIQFLHSVYKMFPKDFKFSPALRETVKIIDLVHLNKISCARRKIHNKLKIYLEDYIFSQLKNLEILYINQVTRTILGAM